MVSLNLISSIKNIVFVIGLCIGVSIIGYFGINRLLDVPNTQSTYPYSKKETKNIIVDSLLVVVDSLTVQVDSLHREGNKTNTVFTPQKVDTAFIINQYYNTYRQTIKHRDKNLDFRLNFDLIQNKIQSPKLAYKILKPVVIFKPETRNTKHFFVGATLGGSLISVDQFTPEIIFFTGKHGFKIGYNLLDPNRNIQIGYYFKIK